MAQTRSHAAHALCVWNGMWKGMCVSPFTLARRPHCDTVTVLMH
jgi:hypothetical protein